MPLFRRRKQPAFEGGGLVLFMDVPEAMKAEKVLKRADYAIKLVAPPPALRRGCDLAIAFNLAEQLGVERALHEGEAFYVEIAPLKVGTAPLLQIVKTTDFGDWVMVKAANMKLVFEKRTGIICNTSGGGCPDIPYLHLELVGKKLTKAPRPRDLGFTLCSLMLDRALEEGLAMWEDPS